MSPTDLIQVLTQLGLTQYIKYVPIVFAVLATIGYVWSHVMAFVSPPKDTSSGWWKFLYKILNCIAANYGHSENKVTLRITAETDTKKS